MLVGNKNIYKQIAERIPEWKKQSNSDLIRNFVKYKNSDAYKADGYMSAIMLKYWSNLNSYYYGKARGNRIYAEDCYDWLTQAVITITNNHIWDQPYIHKKIKSTGKEVNKPNSLYNNPNAPDIALNICIKSMRLGFYQASNYDVRKINYETLSLDKLEEDENDYIIPVENNTFDIDINIKHLVQKYFNSKDYASAFILEGILNGDVFEQDKKESNAQIFSKKKLAKHLRNLDDTYCKTVSKMFDIDLDKIIEASKIYRNINTNKMYRLIDKNLLKLKNEIKTELAF